MDLPLAELSCHHLHWPTSSISQEEMPGVSQAYFLIPKEDEPGPCSVAASQSASQRRQRKHRRGTPPSSQESQATAFAVSKEAAPCCHQTAEVLFCIQSPAQGSLSSLHHWLPAPSKTDHQLDPLVANPAVREEFSGAVRGLLDKTSAFSGPWR